MIGYIGHVFKVNGRYCKDDVRFPHVLTDDLQEAKVVLHWDRFAHSYRCMCEHGYLPRDHELLRTFEIGGKIKILDITVQGMIETPEDYTNSKEDLDSLFEAYDSNRQMIKSIAKLASGWDEESPEVQDFKTRVLKAEIKKGIDEADAGHFYEHKDVFRWIDLQFSTVISDLPEEIQKDGMALFEDEYRFMEWMFHPLRVLGNKPPYDVMKEEGGEQKILDLINRLRHGIFS